MLNPETLALAVINDGATYAERKRLTKLYVETPSETLGNSAMAQAERGFRAMCHAEQCKAIYEGARLSYDDISAAVSHIVDYMLTHYAESNNGADWS